MLLREKRYHDAADCFSRAVKHVNERSAYNNPDYHELRLRLRNGGLGRNRDRARPDSDTNTDALHRSTTESSQRQSRSRSTTTTTTTMPHTSANTNGTPNMSLSSSATIADTSTSSESPRASSTSSRTTFDFFYLLLDGENGSNSNSNSCNKCNGHCSSSSDVDSSNNNNNKREGTYVFRNPIVVVERDPAPTIGNNCFCQYPLIRTFVPNDIEMVGNTSSNSTTSPTITSTTSTSITAPSSTETPRTAAATTSTTIDKENCVKLSLVSVYNIALTYHLAALDSSSSHRQTNRETNNKSLETTTNKVNDNDAVAAMKMNAKNRGRTAADEAGTTSSSTSSTPDTSKYAYFAHPPPKRQRVENCRDVKSNNTVGHITSTNIINNTGTNNSNSNTSMTPYGECASPYHKNIRSETLNNTHKNSSGTSNNDSSSTIDHVLLRQSLAYYEIAYRMLVSEQNVLISQAMVILNNIGHVHRLMGSEENARACFQRLLTIMMYLQQTGEFRQIGHWDSFLTNVIDLIVPAPKFSNEKFAPAA